MNRMENNHGQVGKKYYNHRLKINKYTDLHRPVTDKRFDFFSTPKNMIDHFSYKKIAVENIHIFLNKLIRCATKFIIGMTNS